MNVSDRERFGQLVKRNQDLAARAADPKIRAAHEAWARFYVRLLKGTDS
jgi:hypothetical protein